MKFFFNFQKKKNCKKKNFQFQFFILSNFGSYIAKWVHQFEIESRLFYRPRKPIFFALELKMVGAKLVRFTALQQLYNLSGSIMTRFPAQERSGSQGPVTVFFVVSIEQYSPTTTKICLLFQLSRSFPQSFGPPTCFPTTKS